MSKLRKSVVLGTSVACITLAFSSCAERDAQRAVQASLTALAHSVDAADKALAGELPGAAEEARTRVLLENESGNFTSEEDALNRYDQLMAGWLDAVRALRTARDALYLGQAAFDAWLIAGDLPYTWQQFCTRIGESVGAFTELAGTLGVHVPGQFDKAGQYAEQACRLAAPWMAQAPSASSEGEEEGEGVD